MALPVWYGGLYRNQQPILQQPDSVTIIRAHHWSLSFCNSFHKSTGGKSRTAQSRGGSRETLQMAGFNNNNRTERQASSHHEECNANINGKGSVKLACNRLHPIVQICPSQGCLPRCSLRLATLSLTTSLHLWS